MNDIDFSAIELLVLDVDGVMTDGSITYTPSGEEIKTFNVRDGAGMKYWKRVGGKLAVITGRGSPAVSLRAAELGVDAIRLNVKDKLSAYREVLAELGVKESAAAIVGDDLMELPLMQHCAFGVAVADAVAELRAAADYVTRLGGGRGAVREVIELILKRSGKWELIMQRYIAGQRSPQP